MNIRKVKGIVILILISVIMNITNTYATTVGSFSVSANSTQLDVGSSTSLKISTTNCEGQFSISSSDSSIVTVSSQSEWVTGTTDITLTAKKQGTAVITVTATNVGDNQQEPEDVTGSKSVTITVKEKTNTDNNNSNTNNENKPSQEPTFTATNQTVYATSDVNVRSSYSTSSSSVGSLKKGDSITRTGIGSNGWSKVTYNGTTAYINSSYLTTTKPEEEKKSTNKALKSLSIEQATLEPEFNKDTTNYSITVGKDIDSLKISAVAEDEKAKVTISGNEKLQAGNNTVKVLVTAEDGTIRTYTIIVTKEEKDKLKLSSLEIDGISLNEKFNSDTYEYTANLDGKSNVTKLNIKATANDENATIEVIGNESLVVGENVVTIMVKSKDGSENVTYQILVNKSENTNTEATSNTEKNNKMFIFWAIGIFAIAVILIILIIIKSKKKSKEETEFGFDYNNDNITEELYGIKKEDEIKENIEKINNIEDMEETYSDTTDHTKLYDVEKEVDLSEDERKTKKKGKHSK